MTPPRKSPAEAETAAAATGRELTAGRQDSERPTGGDGPRARASAAQPATTPPGCRGVGELLSDTTGNGIFLRSYLSTSVQYRCAGPGSSRLSGVAPRPASRAARPCGAVSTRVAVVGKAGYVIVGAVLAAHGLRVHVHGEHVTDLLDSVGLVSARIIPGASSRAWFSGWTGSKISAAEWSITRSTVMLVDRSSLHRASTDRMHQVGTTIRVTVHRRMVSTWHGNHDRDRYDTGPPSLPQGQGREFCSLWTIGLRPRIGDGRPDRRVGLHGLAPNVYYRLGTAQGWRRRWFDDPGEPEGLRVGHHATGTGITDESDPGSRRWLDALLNTAPGPVGVTGYCMGRLAHRAAALRPSKSRGRRFPRSGPGRRHRLQRPPAAAALPGRVRVQGTPTPPATTPTRSPNWATPSTPRADRSTDLPGRPRLHHVGHRLPTRRSAPSGCSDAPVAARPDADAGRPDPTPGPSGTGATGLPPGPGVQPRRAVTRPIVGARQERDPREPLGVPGERGEPSR